MTKYQNQILREADRERKIRHQEAKRRKYLKDEAGVHNLDSLNGVLSVEDFWNKS